MSRNGLNLKKKTNGYQIELKWIEQLLRASMSILLISIREE